jgi:hypothetical protein
MGKWMYWFEWKNIAEGKDFSNAMSNNLIKLIEEGYIIEGVSVKDRLGGKFNYFLNINDY